MREAFAAITTVNLPIIYPFIVGDLRLLRNRTCPKDIAGLPCPSPPFFPSDCVIIVTNEVGIEMGERQDTSVFARCRKLQRSDIPTTTSIDGKILTA